MQIGMVGGERADVHQVFGIVSAWPRVVMVLPCQDGAMHTALPNHCI